VATYELEHVEPDESGIAFVGLSGELDLTNVDDLAQRLDDVAGGDAPTVLDLNRVVFIDSAAIHRLFRIARERGPQRVAFVVESSAPVASALEIAEFRRGATVASTLAEAKATLMR
jgi:anti-anti-sigma factor